MHCERVSTTVRKSAGSIALFLFASTLLAADRAAVFRAEGFPTVDAAIVPDDAFDGLPVDRVSDLSGLSGYKVLVFPYGSAFPAAAWNDIKTFVRGGGSLVVLGGAPFHQPVPGNRTPSYARELLIGPAEEVPVPDGVSMTYPDWSWSLPVNARRTWALTLRLATRPHFPAEHGSEGPHEGVARPLVHLNDAAGIPRACPLLQIDRTDGARWIFATTDAPIAAETIRSIVRHALEGSSFVTASPVHASVEPGEIPRIRVSGSGGIVVRDDRGREIVRQPIESPMIEIRRPLRPGLYHVEVIAPNARAATGFWVRDAALLARGPKITVSRDWLRRDGEVFPINGTTYMASDVHRQFLFEPNPHVWDHDFAQMKRLGINFVRTGIWTGWSKATGEPFLRALDAYVQTAAKHDIVVNFTFYAFLPLAYGGTNPYLDPKSLAGQREFVTTIASRFRGAGWIHYDLINEPSYAPPDRLWSNTPIGDEHEKRAFTGGNFVEFSNAAVAGWARTLREAIREAAGDVLVTLGQDEGGTWHRPSQQLHADAVDYTCLHPWWQNDDVLANGVFAKVPEKPSLFQEVGLMRLEDPAGWPWRSPEIASSLLERKYGYAFAARSAGAVQWAWNINPYMPIDNESVIGFFRPDGTAKPELQIAPKMAAFFRAAGPWLDDFEPDEVIVVIPQRRLFMNRPAALDGFRRLIRVMAERFGVVPTALSDLRLTPERLRSAKLVIAPSLEFPVEALKSAPNVLTLGAVDGGGPVPFREDGATFDRNLQESLLRSTEPRTATCEPLPLEYAREEEPLVRLLANALAAAGVTTHPSDTPVAARLLYAPRAILGVVVNDNAEDAVRRLTVAGREVDIPVRAGRMRLVLFERTSGRELASTP
jgi:hypothetical protein